jgi:hypothetical protein
MLIIIEQREFRPIVQAQKIYRPISENIINRSVLFGPPNIQRSELSLLNVIAEYFGMSSFLSGFVLADQKKYITRVADPRIHYIRIRIQQSRKFGTWLLFLRFQMQYFHKKFQIIFDFFVTLCSFELLFCS